MTPGVLTADPHTNAIASALRSLMTQVTKISGTAGAVKSLSDLGFQTNGKDNTISLSNNAALTSALANHLSDVSALFATAASGLGTQLNNYVTNTTGANGTLTAHGATLTKQSATISTQIANLENKIAADSANLTTEFQNMETATARTNQQLTFLSRSIASGSL